MTGSILLGVALVGLVAAGIVGRRPPPGPLPDHDACTSRWQDLHGGVDPRGNPWLRGWLAVSFAVARPLARAGIAPDVVTFGSAWLALAAVVAAGRGGGWAVTAGWVIVSSGLADSLDGAVALMTDRTSRWGYVLDSVVDRLTEALFLTAAWLVGAHPAVVVVAGVLGFLIEYTRARARNAGGSEVGTITVGERAVRVICCGLAVSAAGIAPGRAPLVATASITLLALLGVVGLTQLGVVVRRDLAPGDRPAGSR